MRVMITGGTGFIGYHTAQALLAAGHEVSLLVRSEKKMRGLFGRGAIRHFTVGDITDRDKVRAALAGCDAAIHIAALVSTHARDARKVYDTNLSGVENVIGSAVELGLDPVIHVSSVTALYNPRARVLDEHSPPGTARSGYGRSKVDCEKYVRQLQDAGAPVYITYPGSVLGPDAPELTEPHIGLRTYLAQFVPIMTSGNQYVDVRDLAEVHLKLVEGQADPGRYLLGGEFVSWADLGPMLDELTGRRLLKLPVSGALMRLSGRLYDRLEKFIPLDLPITEEGMGYATRWVQMDNSKVETALGFEFRPVEESLADTIRWMCQAGHITAKQAGVLAE